MHAAVEVEVEDNDNPSLHQEYQSYEIKENKYYHHSFRSLEKLNKILILTVSFCGNSTSVPVRASQIWEKKAAELNLDFNFLNRTEVRTLVQFELRIPYEINIRSSKVCSPILSKWISSDSRALQPSTISTGNLPLLILRANMVTALFPVNHLHWKKILPCDD